MTATGRPTLLIVGHGRDPVLLESSVRDEGFEPETVAGPIEAVLRAVRPSKDPVGAVLFRAGHLVDDDLSSISALRASLPAATIIILFGEGERERAARALQAGADASLGEPFYPVELRALLRRRAAASAAGPEAPARDRRSEVEAIGRLAGGAAHEINNPLTIISGWVQVLLAEAPEDDPRRRALAAIRDEASRIARIIADLQTYARQKPLALSAVDLSAIVREELESPESKSNLQGRRLLLALAESPPLVPADARQVREIVRHLIRNAATATAGGGEIRVESFSGASGVSLVVRDTGSGVAVEERDRIFDPFYPGSPAGSGPGLGLAVSLAIAKNHGGELVLLESDEKGTAFRLTLPHGASPGPS